MVGSIIVFIVPVVFIGLSSWIPIHLRWIITIALYTWFMGVVGQHVTGSEIEGNNGRKRFVPGRFAGVLIDSSNKMSLSRLQITLWTILIFSVTTVIGLDRSIPVLEGRVSQSAGETSSAESAGEQHGALNIVFPGELLAALGISTTSLAAASLIKSGKTETKSNKVTMLLDDQIRLTQKEIEDIEGLIQERTKITEEIEKWSLVDTEEARAKLNLLRPKLLTIESELKKRPLDKAQENLKQLQTLQDESRADIRVNKNISEAKWSDLFNGDLISNFGKVDVAKVQMFYFTVLLIFTYGTLLWGLLSQEPAWQLSAAVELPPFSDSLVGLLGISHAGYLAVKQTGG
ncbi:MAG: hypothetical protein HUU11_03060 [Anaerolineales bacterium]|nr:hypothetical protein [Anaerolineales bacterium]NUQ83670.1 hypothetical protein [Anaerolineales bacterium]